MLKYTFIEPEGMVHHIDNYFDNWYEDEWMKDSDVCSIIKDIDKSTVLSASAVDSPIFGVMPITKISGGSKALILALKTDLVIWSPYLGDNCTEWLLKIAETKDVVVFIDKHYLKAICIDNDVITTTYNDYLEVLFNRFNGGAPR